MHLRYPPQLPITDRKDEIVAAIDDHQVVVLAGETGSGKSTQLPKMCLELGLGDEGLIGHTQPRRLAARTVAERVAEELGTTVGELVGYTVRFTDRVGEQTLVKVMTDGILLTEIQRDPLLRRYSTLIVDEAHERSLNIDFILGYLKQLLPRRPDLKLVITSATIDTARFAAHFGDAPVIEVSGRTYPVEVRYRPLVDPDQSLERDQTEAVCEAVEELRAEGPGDVLVFLSGEREIHDTADALRALDLPGTELLPLYARLSAAEQHRVFQPHAGRRIVLATNVAETSLTVPGIRYVVDAGTARVSRYNRRTKVQRLPIEPVSQAAANQRAGRCGRVAPGICIRLYAEDDFEARPPFTEPEILRTNLASVILQMESLGLGEVAEFPFLDPPDARSVKDGVTLLEELGALAPGEQSGRRLTRLGRRLAQLPVDPRLGRMVLEADRHGCVREVLVIAAALSIQDPRERPPGKQQVADQHHARFTDPDSDFLSLLNLWHHVRERQRELSSNQFRRLCRDEFLNHLRIREWMDIYSQLRQVAGGLGVRLGTEAGSRDGIHISLLSGLLSQIGLKDGVKAEYVGARNARFAIGRGSAVAKKPPKWVMAAELVETNRLWARTVARIQPEWVERAGSHLVQRTYSEPTWDAGRGAVMAIERVTLYGLPIVAGRRVDYGRVDPALARELFIRHALVDGDWETHHRFFHDNAALIDDVLALEARARRRDILVDDDVLFDFYDQRLPSDVRSARHFDRWWKKASAGEPGMLDFTLELLTGDDRGQLDPHDFPDAWRQRDLLLPITYELDPASAIDGVTVHVPLAVLNRVQPTGFDWLVPGRRAELVAALIRSLPKQVRRHVTPAAEHAASFLELTSPADGPLLEVLARHLARRAGIEVMADDFDITRLPPHLVVTFQVDDDAGEPLAMGKDLVSLQHQLSPQVKAAISEAAGGLERTGLAQWEVGDLPSVVEVERSGQTVRGYPALVDEGQTVGLRVLSTRAEQRVAHWGGTRRLLRLAVPTSTKALSRQLGRDSTLALTYAPHDSTRALIDDCTTSALNSLMARHGGLVWDEAGFDELRAQVQTELPGTLLEIVETVARLLHAARRIEQRVDELASPGLLDALTDARVQLARLVYPGFVAASGADRLRHLERYLRAIERRLDALPTNPARDADRMRRIQQLWSRYEAVARTRSGPEIRWMIEELRVSLFAQSLGTAHPVSEKRILDAIAAA